MKKLTWLLLAAVAIFLGWRFWGGSGGVAAPSVSPDDTTVTINQELNKTDFGNLDAEIQSTDADLNSL